MFRTKLKEKITDIIYKLTLSWLVIFLLYWLLQITTFCSFHTPSGSMIPTILPDENGLVNKLKMGARIFNISDAVNGRPFEIKRLPGYGKLDRGDIIIFNYPYLDSDKNSDSIAMNLRTYYCKRAVAVAGDSLEIRDCFYRIRGCQDILGVLMEQESLYRYVADFSKTEPDSTKWPGWMQCQPMDSVFGWNVKDFGPMLIPGKRNTVELDYRNWLLYRRYIEWETKEKLIWKDSMALLGGNAIKFYKFTENYCFAAGDHVIDSRDSRYFGLIPEKFIVGTAGIIWKSKDRKRLFNRLNIH